MNLAISGYRIHWVDIVAIRYFIRRNGKVTGPYTIEAVKEAARSKQLTADDLVATSKDGPWEKVVIPPASANSGSLETKSLKASTRPTSRDSESVKCEDCQGEFSKDCSLCPHCGLRRQTDANETKTIDDNSFFQVLNEASSLAKKHKKLLRPKPQSDELQAPEHGSSSQTGRRNDVARRESGRKIKRRSHSVGLFSIVAFVYESIPDFVKIFVFVAVMAWLFVGWPLVHFQHQSYLAEGSRFGSNTLDTMAYSRLKSRRPAEAAIHMSRREFRKTIVEVDTLLDRLGHKSATPLKARLDAIADHYLLKVAFVADDLYKPDAENRKLTLAKEQLEKIGTQLSGRVSPQITKSVESALDEFTTNVQIASQPNAFAVDTPLNHALHAGANPATILDVTKLNGVYECGDRALAALACGNLAVKNLVESQKTGYSEAALTLNAINTFNENGLFLADIRCKQLSVGKRELAVLCTVAAVQETFPQQKDFRNDLIYHKLIDELRGTSVIVHLSNKDSNSLEAAKQALCEALKNQRPQSFQKRGK